MIRLLAKQRRVGHALMWSMALAIGLLAIFQSSYGMPSFNYVRELALTPYKDGRVYVADPALGNISFDETRFKAIWENNTLFLINVPKEQQRHLLALDEKDLRHVDDATVNRFAFVDAQFNSDYTNKIADRAATMRLFIDKDPYSETYNQPVRTYMRLYYKRK